MWHADLPDQSGETMKALPEIFALHAEADHVMATIARKTAENGLPITCPGLGCSACCYEPAYADRLEIEHALGRLTPADRRYVKLRTREWLDKVKPSGLLAHHLPNAFAWRAMRAPCPFLFRTARETNGYGHGHCLIYKDRPVSCRMFCVIGPPENCYNDAARPKQPVPICDSGVAYMGLCLGRLFKKVEHDHIGVFLAEMLLGEHVDSGTNRKETIPKGWQNECERLSG